MEEREPPEKLEPARSLTLPSLNSLSSRQSLGSRTPSKWMEGLPPKPHAPSSPQIDSIEGILGRPNTYYPPAWHRPLDNLILLYSCGVLQLPEKSLGAPCCQSPPPCPTPVLLSLVPSLGAAAAEVVQTAAFQAFQGAPHGHDVQQPIKCASLAAAAAALGAATAAAVVASSLAPAHAGDGSKSGTMRGSPDLRTNRSGGIATQSNTGASEQVARVAQEDAAAFKQDLEGVTGTSERPVDSDEEADHDDEVEGIRVKTLLCTYCGQPRPCKATCPLGVALAAIQGLHLRGNYCTGRFRVCCYISEPNNPHRHAPGQGQQQEQQGQAISKNPWSSQNSGEHLPSTPVESCSQSFFPSCPASPALLPEFMLASSMPAYMQAGGSQQQWDAAAASLGPSGMDSWVSMHDALPVSACVDSGGGQDPSSLDPDSAACVDSGGRQDPSSLDPDSAAAAAVAASTPLPDPLPLPLSPASLLAPASQDTMAAIVAAAAAAAVRTSEDGSVAGLSYQQQQQLEVVHEQFQGALLPGQEQYHHHLLRQQDLHHEQQQQPYQRQAASQHGLTGQQHASVDHHHQHEASEGKRTNHASWQVQWQGQGEMQVQQLEYRQLSKPVTPSRIENSSTRKLRPSTLRSPSFVAKDEAGVRGKGSKHSGSDKPQIFRTFRSLGNSSASSTAAAATSAASAADSSQSGTSRFCPEPSAEGPKKMHMQRKGRFLVVSYEDVVSAAKAAAVAAIVSSADEDHGAAAAAAAAAASLTEADTQQLSSAQQHQQQAEPLCTQHYMQQEELFSQQGLQQQQRHDDALQQLGAGPSTPSISEAYTSAQEHCPLPGPNPHDTTGLSAAPEGSSVPAAVAATAGDLPGVLLAGGEGDPAAAAAMLEHAANVVAGHVLGECGEVISMALGGPLPPSGWPSPYTSPPNSLPVQLSSLAHAHLHTQPGSPHTAGLLYCSPGLSRLRHSASSPALHHPPAVDDQLQIQLSDRDAGPAPVFLARTSTTHSGSVTAPSSSAHAAGPAHTSSSASSQMHVTSDGVLPGAGTGTPHLQQLPASLLLDPTPSLPHHTTAASKGTTKIKALTDSLTEGTQAPQPPPPTYIGHISCSSPQTHPPHLATTHTPLPFGPSHPSSAHSNAPSHPAQALRPRPHRSSSPGSLSLPSSSSSPPLHTHISLPSSAGRRLQSNTFPSLATCTFSPGPSPVPSPPRPKEYKRGRFKVIEVKAAGAASPISSTAPSPLGLSTSGSVQTEPSTPSQANPLSATSSAACQTEPTTPSHPHSRPISPPLPIAFPHTSFPSSSAWLQHRELQEGQPHAFLSTVLPLPDSTEDQQLGFREQPCQQSTARPPSSPTRDADADGCCTEVLRPPSLVAECGIPIGHVQGNSCANFSAPGPPTRTAATAPAPLLTGLFCVADSKEEESMERGSSFTFSSPSLHSAHSTMSPSMYHHPNLPAQHRGYPSTFSEDSIFCSTAVSPAQCHRPSLGSLPASRDTCVHAPCATKAAPRSPASQPMHIHVTPCSPLNGEHLDTSLSPTLLFPPSPSAQLPRSLPFAQPTGSVGVEQGAALSEPHTSATAYAGAAAPHTGAAAPHTGAAAYSGAAYTASLPHRSSRLAAANVSNCLPPSRLATCAPAAVSKAKHTLQTKQQTQQPKQQQGDEVQQGGWDPQHCPHQQRLHWELLPPQQQQLQQPGECGCASFADGPASHPGRVPGQSASSLSSWACEGSHDDGLLQGHLGEHAAGPTALVCSHGQQTQPEAQGRHQQQHLSQAQQPQKHGSQQLEGSDQQPSHTQQGHPQQHSQSALNRRRQSPQSLVHVPHRPPARHLPPPSSKQPSALALSPALAASAAPSACTTPAVAQAATAEHSKVSHSQQLPFPAGSSKSAAPHVCCPTSLHHQSSASATSSTALSPLSSPAITPVTRRARKVGRFTIREEKAM